MRDENKNGFIGHIMDWTFHASNSKGTVLDWFAGLVLVLILAFLWKQVIDAIE